MPATNTIANPTTDDSATAFTPMADPAFGLDDVPEPEPEVVLVEPPDPVPVPLAPAATTGATVRPSLLLHASPLSAVALARKTISAQLYNALPSSPSVTTCRLPCDPSVTGRSAGTASLGMHSVPLPVAFQKGLVSV